MPKAASKSDDKFTNNAANFAGRWIDREGPRRKARWAIAEWRIVHVYQSEAPLLVLVKVHAWTGKASVGMARDAKQRRYWGRRGRNFQLVTPGNVLMIVERPFFSRWRVLPREVSEDET